MTPIPLAVVAALEEEIKSLRSRSAWQERSATSSGRITAGTWGGLPLLLVRTGMGATATRRTLRRLLSDHSPGLCLQIGFAGAAEEGLRPGDLVIVTEIIDATLGLTFPVAEELLTRAEMIRRQTGLPGRFGRLLTVPQPVLTPREKAAAARKRRALALDMESAVFAGVCRIAGLPFLVVRAILDPLEFQFPNLYRGQWKRIFKSHPLRDFAEAARRSLEVFTAAWLDGMAEIWRNRPGESSSPPLP